MGSDTYLTKLSLELRPPYTPRTISEFLRELKFTENKSQRLSKLNDYIRELEDELHKIEAFKRELPLSVLLLADAILTLKEERSKYGGLEFRCSPTVEKSNCEESVGPELVCVDSEKKSWLRSAQLWSSGFNFLNLKSGRGGESDRTASEKETGYPLQQPTENQSGAPPEPGANMSFPENSGIWGPNQRGKDQRPTASVPGLHLPIPGFPPPDRGDPEASDCGVGSGGSVGGGGGLSSGAVLVADQIRSSAPQHRQAPYQSARKQRRCWSPDLHRLFVDALEKLGGPQVATPKQIRELMQVDGLTNDEVKSHLQKYRLHVRKLPASSTQTNDGSNLSQNHDDHLEGCSKAEVGQSTSPEGPLHMALTSAKCSSAGTTTCTLDSNGDEADDHSSHVTAYSWRSSVQHLHRRMH